MKWSWNIGRLAGIPIKIHATFALILIWVGMIQWTAVREWGAVFSGIVFVMAIFGCVVLHELGHALTARRYGIKTKDITLLPIGGLARLEKMPDVPIQEVWVALAGPAVNVVIAAGLFLWIYFTGHLEFPRLDAFMGESLFHRLLLVNVILVVFNLLPAFPMDGGRVLRGLLATRLSYTRATQIAANLGQGMAFLFGILGLMFNPFLIFIALFVWIGAAQEANYAEVRSVLAGVPVQRAMLTEYRTVSPHDSLSQVVEKILAGSQQDFPVLEDGRIQGVLTRNDLMVGLAKSGPHTPVREAMRCEFKVVDANEMLERVFGRLQGAECKAIPVTHLGELVGLLTLENVSEFVMIQSALDEGRRPA